MEKKLAKRITEKFFFIKLSRHKFKTLHYKMIKSLQLAKPDVLQCLTSITASFIIIKSQISIIS